MPTRPVSLLVGMLLAATVGATALQQLTPYLPPPEGDSVYDIIGLRPAPAVPCTCVPNAFVLPSYRPGWGYGSGPATPTGNAPISEADRRTNREWHEQEAQLIRRVSDEALGGNNSNASLAVALHFSLRKIIVGDDRDEGESLRWLTFAADQGSPDAFRLLAYHYAHGIGVARDEAKAVFLIEQGATRGDPISMTVLGFLLAAGRDGTQNLPAAVRWWQRAEARSPVASRFLGDAYACGAGVPEDRARALAAYKRSAEREPSSSIQLGHMYVRGCAPPDDKAALEAFTRAADQGYPDAQIELSDLLLKGRGAEPNPQDAYYWARLADERLPAGDLKTRADERAAAAARAMSAPEIAAGDERVTSVIASGAKPVR